MWRKHFWDCRGLRPRNDGPDSCLRRNDPTSSLRDFAWQANPAIRMAVTITPPSGMAGLNKNDIVSGTICRYYYIMAKRLVGYMITWTIYGTWLQGDKRGYVKDGVILPKDEKPESANQKRQKFQTVKLNSGQKHIVREAILQEAQKINQEIPAIAVCSNHIHIVAKVSAESIERIVHRYKRLAAFVLRKAGLNGKIWSKGFDKRFCFTDKDIEQKVKYVNGHE